MILFIILFPVLRIRLKDGLNQGSKGLCSLSDVMVLDQRLFESESTKVKDTNETTMLMIMTSISNKRML
jgi:hypothetical protein